MAIATLSEQYNCAESLSETTQSILHSAFYLAKKKVELSAKAYKQLVRDWGWDNEDKKYIKVAQTFEKFSPLDLAQIEPDTIFLLSKHNKKYKDVVEQLLDIGCITQEKVRQLIKQQRKSRAKKSDKPSIWRRDANGKRYCQVPPIRDEEAGVALQSMMDLEGLSAQQIVAEALALRQAMKEGCLSWTISDEDSQDEDLYVENDSSVEDAYQDSCNINSTVDIDSQIDSDECFIFSDIGVVNSSTIQKTVESLSNSLFSLVENIVYFNSKENEEAQELIADIINFCNQQPFSNQWDTLAKIIRRNFEVLSIVIGYSGKEHREWFFNLPKILANAALENPKELEWVGKQLRSEALSLISRDKC